MIVPGASRNIKLAGAWLLPLLALLTAGCHRSDSTETAYRPVPANRVLDFATLYGQNCAGCHGVDGTLGPAPPLNDPLFLSIVPDSVVLGLISGGRPGTPMPGFALDKGGPLTNDQVKALAAGLKLRWKPDRGSHTDVPPYLAGESAAAGDKERGLKVFSRACAPCHGANGEGNPDQAGAINDPAFLALISDQCLRRFAITGRPDLDMPDFADDTNRSSDYKPLTSAEITDLVALLAHWRKAGTAPPPAGRARTVKKRRDTKSPAR